MNITKEKTVCFSGYRPGKFRFSLKPKSKDYETLLGHICISVILSVEDGYDTYLCGMARGFDIICGENVERLRRVECPHIRLYAVMPYMGHGGNWSGEWRDRHNKLLANADKIIYVNEEFSKSCYHERNRCIVDHSGRLICFWDGQNGGTAYTHGYAREKGLEVVNIADKKGFLYR